MGAGSRMDQAAGRETFLSTGPILCVGDDAVVNECLSDYPRRVEMGRRR